MCDEHVYNKLLLTYFTYTIIKAAQWSCYGTLTEHFPLDRSTIQYVQ